MVGPGLRRPEDRCVVHEHAAASSPSAEERRARAPSLGVSTKPSQIHDSSRKGPPFGAVRIRQRRDVTPDLVFLLRRTAPVDVSIVELVTVAGEVVGGVQGQADLTIDDVAETACKW